MFLVTKNSNSRDFMTDLSLETIETETTNSNLERGRSYFYSGQVKDIRIINDHFIQATVNGHKNYRVFIEMVAAGYKSYCTCPYNSKGNCKHAVAVKLALIKDPESINCIALPQWKEIVIKYFNRLLNLLFLVKYKFF